LASLLLRCLEMKTAVFFERDGVLNQCETVRGHQVVPRQLEEFRVVPEAAHLLAELKTLGFLLIATTNQPGIPSEISDATRWT